MGSLLGGDVAAADSGRHRRKGEVDMSAVIKPRRDVKQATVVALAVSKPGRSLDPRDVEIDQLNGEVARLTETIEEQAIELARLTPGPNASGRPTTSAGRWLLIPPGMALRSRSAKCRQLMPSVTDVVSASARRKSRG